jgi:5-methylcytosine-specific restriction endonuclease McrA
MKSIKIIGKRNQDKINKIEKPQRLDAKKWSFTDDYYTYDKQVQLVNMLFLKEDMEHKAFFEKEINKKINGYKQQDIDKKLLDDDLFISFDEVVEHLMLSKLKCFYCREIIELIYKDVRAKKQWTLDRKDNDYGHNRDNVVIACLDCNLKRGTMNMEKFKFTKQLKIVKT